MERLSAASVDLACADNFAGALREARSREPEAIVLDVHLDADTGIAGLRRLRRAAPRALIVVLTNEASEVHRRECLRHGGADAFLDKSREFDRLVDLVLELEPGSSRQG